MTVVLVVILVFVWIVVLGAMRRAGIF